MKNSNPHISAYIGIAVIIGIVSLVATTLITILSPDNLHIAPWIIGGLSTLGIALGYFISQSQQQGASLPAVQKEFDEHSSD